MELFVEQDSTYDKCLKKITKKHGDAVTIWRRKDAKSSRLFGLFEKDVVEVTIKYLRGHPYYRNNSRR